MHIFVRFTVDTSIFFSIYRCNTCVLPLNTAIRRGIWLRFSVLSGLPFPLPHVLGLFLRTRNGERVSSCVRSRSHAHSKHASGRLHVAIHPACDGSWSRHSGEGGCGGSGSFSAAVAATASGLDVRICESSDGSIGNWVSVSGRGHRPCEANTHIVFVGEFVVGRRVRQQPRRRRQQRNNGGRGGVSTGGLPCAINVKDTFPVSYTCPVSTPHVLTGTWIP